MSRGPQHKNECISSQRTLFQNTELIFDKLLPNYTSRDALQCCLFCISEYGFGNTEAARGGVLLTLPKYLNTCSLVNTISVIVIKFRGQIIDRKSF